MRLDKVVKLRVFYYTCSGGGQSDLEVSKPDVSWSDVLWTGRLISGCFWAEQIIGLEGFVGLPREILPQMPNAVR